MNRHQRRPLTRIALAIQRQLESRRPINRLSLLSTDSLKRSRRLLEHVQLVEQRGWSAAAVLCRKRLRGAFEQLKREIEAALDELAAPTVRPLAPLRDIYEDLVALADEFREVQISLKERQISVVTDPVELDGVFLGRFRILLDYERLHEASACYEIIALEPHPAASDESVVHPHARDGSLCEGEAFGPIRAALSNGRLWDFFMVVARTLASYNPDSAFVTLDRWHGRTCADCGYTSADDDDGSSCQACECDLCCDCGACCISCGATNCHECALACRACERSSCEGCLVTCRACDQGFCERCLTDGQCAKCRKDADEEEALGEAEVHSPSAAAPAAAVDRVCLEQASLSA
jgi:hypothetical protein